MIELVNGDCLEIMKDLEPDSIDLIFVDLPYASQSFGKCTACEWDKPIDLERMWSEFMRIKKLHTPIFFSCNVKLGFDLIQSAPKKCHFRYDLVWVKSSCAGFLNSKRSPLRKHEMVYVFYEKQPLYDLSSHKHKFIDKDHSVEAKDGAYGKLQIKQPKTSGARWEPALPTSVVEEIPTSILEIKSSRGKQSTEKPVALMEWVLKYYSKENDLVLDCCMGSGSTGVACKNMNRKFIGMELNTEIFKVAEERLK